MLPISLSSPLLWRLWRYHRLLLVGMWLLVQAAFLVKFHGPHYANDSELYLGYATNVAEHGYYKHEPGLAATTIENNGEANFEYEHNQRYILYPWFQSIWLRLHAGWWGIVLGQMAIAGLAAAGLYSGVQQLAGGQRGPAALATGLFTLWPDTQQFNCYLLTESLFISLSVLCFWAFVRLYSGRWQVSLVLLLLLGLTLFARPNGFVLVGAALMAGLVKLYGWRPRLFWVGVGLLVLAVPVLLVVLNQRLVTYYIVETYQRGELMFGSSAWAIHPSSPLAIPPPRTGQVTRILYFATHNPGFLGRLMVGKLLVFFSSIKPYYSVGHKLMSILILWPLYWFAVRGARRADIWLPGRAFLVAVPLLQAAIIMVTVDDYDVRFITPVLPFIFALVALSISKRVDRLQKVSK
jgi:hypothetical protein